MPRRADRDRCAEWQRRIDASDVIYKEWEDLYRPSRLYDYYLGHQWPPEAKENYVINLFFPTIQEQMPSQLFYHPRAIVKGQPSRLDDTGTTADERAALQQDVLNTFISDPRLGFKQVTREAQLESYFRFGVVEVGYTNDFIDNPNAGKPIMTDELDDGGQPRPKLDGGGQQMMESDVLSVGPNGEQLAEWLYLKYIPADTFRVGVNSKNRLQQCDWCGYYELHYPADLKANRKYRNTAGLKATWQMAKRYSGDRVEQQGDDKKHAGMVKVWKIWDHRAAQRFVFCEGNDKFLLEEPMERYRDGTAMVPFAILKKAQRLGEFLPLPFTFNWVGPQDELNESRNMQRIYRRKLVPKFGVNDAVDQNEIDKFLENTVQVIKLPRQEALWAIDNPAADGAVLRSIPLSKDDFREESGTSGEERGIAEAETATQANIIQISSRIRETQARDQVADWLAEIAVLMLHFIRTRMALPFWIKRTVDPLGPNVAMEALATASTWQQIAKQDLGDISSDVTVDMESIAAASEAAERDGWIQALTLLANPVVGALVLADDVLLRKTMGYFGIKNDKELASLRRTGMMLAMAAAGQQQAAGGSDAAGTAAAGGPAPGPTPDNPEIAQQIAQQMPMGGP